MVIGDYYKPRIPEFIHASILSKNESLSCPVEIKFYKFADANYVGKKGNIWNKK